VLHFNPLSSPLNPLLSSLLQPLIQPHHNLPALVPLLLFHPTLPRLPIPITTAPPTPSLIMRIRDKCDAFHPLGVRLEGVMMGDCEDVGNADGRGVEVEDKDVSGEVPGLSSAQLERILVRF
jgi:hypothetical protein